MSIPAVPPPHAPGRSLGRALAGHLEQIFRTIEAVLERATAPGGVASVDRPAPAQRPAAAPRTSGGTVLMIANFRPDVGFAWWLMENFWVELASVARLRGFEPLILYPIPGRIPDSISTANIETRIEPFPGAGPAGLLRSLRLIRQRRVRWLYLTDRPMTSVRYLLFRLAGVRFIVVHDHSPGDRPAVRGVKGALKYLWRRLPWMSADRVLTVSPFIRERAIASARFPEHRLTVIQNGIEPFDCRGDEGYLQREFGIPAGAEVCVTVGRAHPYKRIDLVIEAAACALRDPAGADLCFIHCGSGPDEERLAERVRELGLEGRFILAGRRSDVKRILCAADFAMHAARGEAFSLAILEYMSAGLAVLVADLPSVRQAIRHGETGIVFRDGDPDDAARHLLELCTRPDRRNALGRAAAEEVRLRYSFAEMNTAFREVFIDLPIA